MNEAEYRTKSINVLNGHANELNSMHDRLFEAAKARKAIPNLKDIFKEMSDTATECAQLLEFYETEEMPKDVRLAMKRVQTELGHCASAFVLYMAIGEALG
jgi:hypothetical protein